MEAFGHGSAHHGRGPLLEPHDESVAPLLDLGVPFHASFRLVRARDRVLLRIGTVDATGQYLPRTTLVPTQVGVDNRPLLKGVMGKPPTSRRRAEQKSGPERFDNGGAGCRARSSATAGARTWSVGIRTCLSPIAAAGLARA